MVLYIKSKVYCKYGYRINMGKVMMCNRYFQHTKSRMILPTHQHYLIHDYTKTESYYTQFLNLFEYYAASNVGQHHQLIFEWLLLFSTSGINYLDNYYC
jgi:hypothetical protein